MLRDDRGLYLQVHAGAEGVIKSWLYRYSVSGKDRTVGLGSYPETNLADARKLADAQRAIRAAGKDPLAEKRAARAELEAKIEAEKTPRPRHSASASRHTSRRIRQPGAIPSLKPPGRARCKPTHGSSAQ